VVNAIEGTETSVVNIQLNNSQGSNTNTNQPQRSSSLLISNIDQAQQQEGTNSESALSPRQEEIKEEEVTQIMTGQHR